MARKPINNLWDRDMRNAIDENFKELYDEYIGAGMSASEAKQKALDALNKSTRALLNSEQTQTELDQAILSGDSSPLGGQLSVGAGNKVYSSPQERLLKENEALTSQLAVRPSYNEVENKVAQIVSGSPKGTYATLTALQTAKPTGDTGVYVVTADGKWYYWNASAWTAGGTYQSTGIGIRTVSKENTDFISTSKNLFNKDTVTYNYRLNESNGTVDNVEGWVTSDYIKVKPNTYYSRNVLASYCLYDENFNFHGGYPPNTTSFYTPGPARYMKVSTQIGNLDSLQFEEGQTSTPYEPPGTNIDGYKVRDIDLSKDLKSTIELYPKRIDEKVNPIKNPYPTTINQMIEDGDVVYAINGGYQKDYFIKWGNQDYGHKVITNGAVTSRLDASFPQGKKIKGVAVIGLWIHLEDHTKVNTITVQVDSKGESGYNWVEGVSSNLKTGWNLLRFASHVSNIENWGTFHKVRVSIATNSTTSWVIGSFFAECPNKAQILFVEDGGYKEFYDIGYPDLKARGIPITWALNPGRLGTERMITEAEVDLLAEDMDNSFSFHSWKSDPTSTMTAEELKTDAIKSIRWIQKKGLQPKYWWRAAFTQNDAPEHAHLRDVLEAYASPNGRGGFSVFPFLDRWNVPRYALHGRSNALMDSYFNTLKSTHCLLVGYTHGIATGSPFDMSQAEWDYFLQKLDEGISDGWLEGVTYDMLRTRHEQQYGGYGFNHLIDATRNN